MLFREGVNIRYYEKEEELPKKHQLLIMFEDNTFLIATASMFAYMGCEPEFPDDKYFVKSFNGVSPLDDEFTYDYFLELFNECKDTMSTKAFIATEQRIVGVGNGTCQDILFNAKLHPKKKLGTYSEADKKSLYNSLKNTLQEMVNHGGRDTEKNLFGEDGGYKTKMSKNTLGEKCPGCSGTVEKANFLGGTIYYCESCQAL